MKNLLALVALGTICAGCGTTGTTQPSAEPREEKEYVTGSMIPKKDRTKGPPVKVVDPQGIQNAMDKASIGRGPAGSP